MDYKFWFQKLFSSISIAFSYRHTASVIDQMIVDIEKNGRYIAESETVKFLYAILVLMYGDYGTSPYSGWIEDKPGCISFLCDMKEDGK